MKQYVILANDEQKSPSTNGMASLGSRPDLFRMLAERNTSSDGRHEDILHGPGFQLEVAPGQDPVTQMLMTIVDEDIAWVVIMRLAKELDWKLLDPMTGRELKAR